jgi:hypothetical protein
MTRTPISLESITVESPCKADWNAMTGDERVRHCRLCRLDVYDLSGLTRPEAETLLTERGESLCVRFFRRADGTVVTRDCVKVADRIRRRLRWVHAAAAVLIAVGIAACGGSKTPKPSPQPTPNPGAESTPAPTPATTPEPDPDPEGETPTTEPSAEPAPPERIMGRIRIQPGPPLPTPPSHVIDEAGAR